jgi:hypothetical protein
MEIAPEIVDAGEEVILGEVDLGGYFSARELAKRVYLAMRERETKLIAEIFPDPEGW